MKSEASEGQLHFLEEAKLLNGFKGLRGDYDLFNLTVKDHQQSQMPNSDLSLLKGHINYALKTYL